MIKWSLYKAPHFLLVYRSHPIIPRVKCAPPPVSRFGGPRS
jgi:hypothetical protein